MAAEQIGTAVWQVGISFRAPASKRVRECLCLYPDVALHALKSVPVDPRTYKYVLSAW